MAVPISNVTRRVVYAASGTGPYAFTFEILAETDIEVYKGDTKLTLTTDYTVTINANGTGSVTLVATAGTDNITIIGARAIQRLSDFVTGGDLFANTINDELDSLTIFSQQNAEGLARSLQAPETDPTTINMTLPRAADRADKFLAFDASGNPVPGAVPEEIQDVLAIETEIVAVAAVDTEIVAVAGITGNIETLAPIAGNITTVAGISSSVTTVAGLDTEIAAVVANEGNIDIVAGLNTEIAALGPIAASIQAVANIDTADLQAVGNIETEIVTVAGVAGNIETLALIAADITTTAGISGNIETVAGISADVTSVAGISAAVSAVNSNSTNINTVATDLAGNNDIGAVAGIAANVTTVANISSNVTTVAGISSDVTTVATNVVDITNFSDVYLGPASSDPATRNDSSALQAGDLYFNTNDDAVKVYTGAAWTVAYVPSNGFLAAANNLSDLTNAATARQNLDLEIGVDVQAYDADTAKYDDVTANFTGTLQNGNSDVVVDTDIGVTVQAYDADTAKLDVAQSFTAQQTFKEVKDTVHTISDGAGFEIDPANGSIQVVTLGASRTPAATNFEAGQVVLLGIDDGTDYTVTWTTVGVTWVTAGGTASAPTLATTGYTWVLLWKVASTIYGTEVGQP